MPGPINYLALMMTDPQVHFHVLPRYASPRDAAGTTFVDDAYPGPPDVKSSVTLDESAIGELVDMMCSHWPGT